MNNRKYGNININITDKINEIIKTKMVGGYITLNDVFLQLHEFINMDNESSVVQSNVRTLISRCISEIKKQGDGKPFIELNFKLFKIFNRYEYIDIKKDVQ